MKVGIYIVLILFNLSNYRFSKIYIGSTQLFLYLYIYLN